MKAADSHIKGQETTINASCLGFKGIATGALARVGWLDGMENATLTSKRHVDDIEAWSARAEIVMAPLSGHTPPALRAVLTEWPLVSALMTEALTAATRQHEPCKVAVFVGGTRWHGQALRETGFRSYLREYAPRVGVLDTAVNLETRQLTYEATLGLLDRVPDLAGLYVAGGGMEGAIAALREARPADRLTLIVNELTPDSSRGLADRYVTMVIATPLQKLCANLVDRMAGQVLHPDGKVPPNAELEPLLYLPESV